MTDKGFWLSVSLAIPLGLFFITLFDNWIDYHVRSHTNSAYKEYWYRSLLPSTAWLVLLVLSINSLLIGHLDNTWRFWIFFGEAFFCLVLALFLCRKTFGYLHNLVYVYGVVIALVILASRVLLWDLLLQLASPNPLPLFAGVIAAWVAIIAAEINFAPKRHSVEMLVSFNIIQIIVTNLWAFFMALAWVFRPLLALK